MESGTIDDKVVPMVIMHAKPVAVTKPARPLHITIQCPTSCCDGRVDFEERSFHGVPMNGSCASCGASFELSGGSLRPTGLHRS